MNILFVVPYAPSPVRTRPYHLIKALTASGHRVTMATLWTCESEQRALSAAFPDVEAVVGNRSTPWRSLWNTARAFPTRDPLQAHVSWHSRLARTLADLVRDGRFDVVHVEHLRGVRYGLALVDALSRAGVEHPPIVWDSVDCISDLCRHAIDQGPHRLVRWAASMELPRTERYEADVLSRFPRVLVTSTRDREGLLRLVARSGPEAAADAADRVVVLPNGVDLGRFSPPAGPRDRATIVMSGKMSYHANVAPATHFATEVLPRIREQRPDVTFVIVGQAPPRQIVRLGARPGIAVTGTVDDVRPYLQRATIAVAPIEYGVGIQNKVLEALACGAPVVATPAAVDGLEITPGLELAVAGGPDAFARTVLRLLDDAPERSRLGQEGRRYVERYHAWSGIRQRLEDVYRDAAA